MSLCVRKPKILYSDQVLHKPGYTAIEALLNFRYIYIEQKQRHNKGASLSRSFCHEDIVTAILILLTLEHLSVSCEKCACSCGDLPPRGLPMNSATRIIDLNCRL